MAEVPSALRATCSQSGDEEQALGSGWGLPGTQRKVGREGGEHWAGGLRSLRGRTADEAPQGQEWRRGPRLPGL